MDSKSISSKSKPNSIIGHKQVDGQDFWRVRWHNYIGPDNYTWEPTSSFTSKEQLEKLARFMANRKMDTGKETGTSKQDSRSKSPSQSAVGGNEEENGGGDGNVTMRKTRSSQKKLGNGEAKEKLNKTNSLPQRKKSISVGQNYQATVPPLLEGPPDASYPGRQVEDCLWNANNGVLDGDGDQVFQYCCHAFQNFGIHQDRSLYILYKANYDLEAAKQELCNPKWRAKCEFSEDDAYSFKNAFIYYGKSFAHVHQVLPHKSLASLVEHYYRTKKQQNYKSSIDQQEAKRRSADETDDEETGPSECNDEDDGQSSKQQQDSVCEVCMEVVRKLYPVNALEICRTCKNYFKASNKHRVCPLSPGTEEFPQRRVPKCPSDMLQIAEEFNEMATIWKGPGFENADEEGDLQVASGLGETFCKVQFEEVTKKRKLLEAQAKRMDAQLRPKHKVEDAGHGHQYSVDEAKAFLAQTAPGPAMTLQEGNFQQNFVPLQQQKRSQSTHTWTQREKEAAVQALIRFRGDCAIVAEIVPTKTADRIKAFYKEHEKAINKMMQERLEEAEATGYLTVEDDQLPQMDAGEAAKDFVEEEEVIELD